jgi:NitT/TauT family transport system substrate-binding protein
MHESHLDTRQVWSQKVVNAVVRGALYAAENKAAVAHMLSRDGKRYLPMPAEVVTRAMTYYDPANYAAPQAIQHADWGSGRIDFQPWPYPSATKLIVNAMNETLVSGDATFLQGLDPQHVADDLVNYDFVRKALAQHPNWVNLPGVDPRHPFEREEVVAL